MSAMGIRWIDDRRVNFRRINAPLTHPSWIWELTECGDDDPWGGPFHSLADAVENVAAVISDLSPSRALLPDGSPVWAQGLYTWQRQCMLCGSKQRVSHLRRHLESPKHKGKVDSVFGGVSYALCVDGDTGEGSGA